MLLQKKRKAVIKNKWRLRCRAIPSYIFRRPSVSRGYAILKILGNELQYYTVLGYTTDQKKTSVGYKINYN